MSNMQWIIYKLPTYLWLLFISVICHRHLATTLEPAEIHFTVVKWLETFFILPLFPTFSSFIASVWCVMWWRNVIFDRFIWLWSFTWLCITIIHFILFRLGNGEFLVTIFTLSWNLKKYRKVCINYLVF